MPPPNGAQESEDNEASTDSDDGHQGRGRNHHHRHSPWSPRTIVFDEDAVFAEVKTRLDLDGSIRLRPLGKPKGGVTPSSRVGSAMVMEHTAALLIPPDSAGRHRTPIAKFEKDYKASSTEPRHDYTAGVCLFFVPDQHCEFREMMRDMNLYRHAAHCHQVVVILEAFVTQARARPENLPSLINPVRLEVTSREALSDVQREGLRQNAEGQFLAWMTALYLFLRVENNPLTIHEWVNLLCDPAMNLSRLLQMETNAIKMLPLAPLPFWRSINGHAQAAHNVPRLHELVNFRTIQEWEAHLAQQVPAQDAPGYPLMPTQLSTVPPTTYNLGAGHRASSGAASQVSGFAPSIAPSAHNYHRSVSQAGSIRPAGRQIHGPRPAQPSADDFPRAWLDPATYDHKAASLHCRGLNLCAFCGNREDHRGQHFVHPRRGGMQHECLLYRTHPEYDARCMWMLALRVCAGLSTPSTQRR